MVLLLSCRDSPSESLRFASAPELACDEILDMVIQHLGRARPHLDAADGVEIELEGRIYARLAEICQRDSVRCEIQDEAREKKRGVTAKAWFVMEMRESRPSAWQGVG